VVYAEGENLVISDRLLARCFELPRGLLKDQLFDLTAWYEGHLAGLESEDEPYDFVDTSVTSSEEMVDGADLKFPDEDHDSMPSFRAISNSTDSDSESSETRPPSLHTVSDSSDEESEEEEYRPLGDPEETFEDRLKTWARATEEFGEPRENEPSQRSHQLGDLMGNTVAALLEFFQPYPGDELVPWSDDRRDSKRFRVLRPADEFYTIEDSYMDTVMVLPLEWLRIPSFHLMEWYARERAKSLDITYREVLPIHKFPIEELLADAVSQYFRDVSRHLPMFELVGIGRILREPEDLNGPDDYVVSIPLEPQGLHAEISEASLLNPKLDLVSWVLKRRLKTLLRENNSRNGWRGTCQTNYFGSMFDEPDLCLPNKSGDGLEGEFVLDCRGVQIPADSLKGLSCTASTPRIPDRIVARPLVIVVRVNGEPVRALVDSGSMNLVDQLKVKRSELHDPITLQLAVQGSRSKINHSVNVKFQYQDISEERTFFVANLSG
jgi:hypothetical protein